jgi:hypothetical protein
VTKLFLQLSTLVDQMNQERPGHGASIRAKHAERVQDCGEDREQAHFGSLTHSYLLQTDMPPGTLVTLLQKSLLFLYVETHVANDGQTIQCDEAFSSNNYYPIEKLGVFPILRFSHLLV